VDLVPKIPDPSTTSPVAGGLWNASNLSAGMPTNSERQQATKNQITPQSAWNTFHSKVKVPRLAEDGETNMKMPWHLEIYSQNK